MTDIQASREAIEAFAKDPIDTGFNELAPWQSANASDFYVPGAALGNSSSAHGKHTFPYEPMTPEEFSKYSGEELDPADDPGGPADWWDWTLEYELTNGRYADPWLRYYDAIEDTGDATSYPAPGDAPWTEELKSSWDDAVNNRCAEVDVVREELAFLMENLVAAAKDYADIDLENTVSLSKYEEELDQ